MSGHSSDYESINRRKYQVALSLTHVKRTNSLTIIIFETYRRLGNASRLYYKDASRFQSTEINSETTPASNQKNTLAKGLKKL